MRTVLDRGVPTDPDVVFTSNPKYRGSVEAIQMHPFFAQLTEIQQRFVLAYLADRDCTRAAFASGTYSSDASAQMAGLRHLRNFRIRTLIDEFFGEAPESSGKPMSVGELEWIITQRLRSGVLNESTFQVLTGQLMELKNWRVLKKMRQAGKRATERAARDRSTVLEYEAEKAREEEEESRFDPFAEVRRLEAKRNSTS